MQMETEGEKVLLFLCSRNEAPLIDRRRHQNDRNLDREKPLYKPFVLLSLQQPPSNIPSFSVVALFALTLYPASHLLISLAELNLVEMTEGERRLSLGLHGFGILSTVAEIFQLINQGSVGGEEAKIISLIVSTSLIIFAASVALPPRYINMCCSISFLFSVSACALLISQFVTNRLFWVPYIACVFPLLHLLQMLPAPLQRSLQLRWWASWNAISDAACRAHHAVVRSLEALLPTSSTVTSNYNPGRSTSSSSSAAPAAAGSVEEGDRC